MANKQQLSPFCQCRLINKKASHEVLVRHVPRVGEFICLAGLDRRQLVVKVRKVVTVIDRHLGSYSFDLLVRTTTLPPSIPGSKEFDLPPPHQKRVKWPDGVSVPVADETVRLKAARSERELVVSYIVHRLNVAKKLHSIEVRLYDATPKPIFDVEAHKRLIVPGLEAEW